MDPHLLKQPFKPWEMTLFLCLCTTPHSILNSFNTTLNADIPNSNKVTYKALFGHEDLNNAIAKVLHGALSSFDPGVTDALAYESAKNIQIPMHFNWSSIEHIGFRIQIAILNYYRFIALHEELYWDDQKYPAARNTLHRAVYEILSSFLDLQLNARENGKHHIISHVITQLFSDLPIPSKWIDLDHIRKEALPLMANFMFNDMYYEDFYKQWFSPVFISSLLAPVLKEDSLSDDIYHYIVPAATMAEAGILCYLPQAFESIRTNNLLSYLFPYHRYPPVYSLFARYIAVVCTSSASVMRSHEDTANGTLNKELNENQQYLSGGRPLALVTILVLSLPSVIEYTISAYEIGWLLEPDMNKILRDLWSGDSGALSKEALRDVEVLVTDMIRPESEYWEGLKKYDGGISLLRGLRQDEHCQLQEELSMRWQAFKNDLDSAQGQDSAVGIEQSSAGMRSDGR
ncbi:hypothetical protein BDZ89DRAFT_1233054 [Hymenopellis radicata]|nr:hypothetical protein BDZ89DRAFT_1233054 [Hymenopellis radicata]